jgi:hypothetical protein
VGVSHQRRLGALDKLFSATLRTNDSHSADSLGCVCVCSPPWNACAADKTVVPPTRVYPGIEIRFARTTSVPTGNDIGSLDFVKNASPL